MKGRSKGRLSKGFDFAACAAQEAQYVPGPLLRDGANEVVLLEMEASPDSPRGAPRPRT